jgi:hypothetical protein
MAEALEDEVVTDAATVHRYHSQRRRCRDRRRRRPGHGLRDRVGRVRRVPEQDLPRLFDVAFRGEAARTPGGGAGLGLAIARGIVEAHAGEIGVYNAAGGCRFVVRLPLDA